MKPGRRGFFGLLSANLVSTAGTSMSAIAVPWFVLTTTGRALDAGLAAFAEMLPYVLMQAAGSPLVDGFGKRRMSILSDILAALGMAAVPLIYLTGSLGFPLLALLLGLVGACRGIGDLARRVLVPGLAEEGAVPLERASGLFDGVYRLAGLLGGPAAGLLLALSSAPFVLVVDAASFGVSALIITFLLPKDEKTRGADGATKGSYLSELAEGLDFLRKDRLLLAIVALILVTNLLDQAYFSVMLPLWAKTVLGSPLAIGILSATFGVGALSGNALMSWLAPKLPRLLPFALSFLICGSPRFFALAGSSSLLPLEIVAFFSGLGAGGINPALGAVEFERVPKRLQARVFGALGALAWLGIPLGGLFGGVLAQLLDLRMALIVTGAIYLLATLEPFIFPAWREMDRRPEALRTMDDREDPRVEKPVGDIGEVGEIDRGLSAAR